MKSKLGKKHAVLAKSYELVVEGQFNIRWVQSEIRKKKRDLLDILGIDYPAGHFHTHPETGLLVSWPTPEERAEVIELGMEEAKKTISSIMALESIWEKIDPTDFLILSLYRYIIWLEALNNKSLVRDLESGRLVFND